MRALLTATMLLTVAFASNANARPATSNVHRAEPVYRPAPPPAVVVARPGTPVYRPAPPPVVVVHPGTPVYRPAPLPPPPPRAVTPNEARRIALDYAHSRGLYRAQVLKLDSKKDLYKVRMELPNQGGRVKLEINRFSGAIVKVDEKLNHGRGQAYGQWNGRGNGHVRG